VRACTTKPTPSHTLAMVGDVLFDRVTGLITVESVAYETFQTRRDTLRRPVHAENAEASR
jgi:hypothetical protein